MVSDEDSDEHDDGNKAPVRRPIPMNYRAARPSRQSMAAPWPLQVLLAVASVMGSLMAGRAARSIRATLFVAFLAFTFGVVARTFWGWRAYLPTLLVIVGVIALAVGVCAKMLTMH